MSLFKSEDFEVFLFNNLSYTRMYPVFRLFHTGAGAELITGDLLHRSWLESFCKRDMWWSHSATDKKLKMPGIAVQYLQIGRLSTNCTTGVVIKLIVHVL